MLSRLLNGCAFVGANNAVILFHCCSRKRSAVWAYFSVSEDEASRDWVTCDLCDDSTKVKTKDSSTTNLFTHLKVHHPTQYAEVATVSLSSGKKSKSKSKISKKSPAQPAIDDAFQSKRPYDKNSERYRQLMKSVTRFLVTGDFYRFSCWFISEEQTANKNLFYLCYFLSVPFALPITCVAFWYCWWSAKIL